MCNERVLLISEKDKVIIIAPDLEDEKKYEGSLIFRGNFDIIVKTQRIVKRILHIEVE